MVWCPLVWDSERILSKGLSIFRFQPLPFLKPTHKGNDRIPTIHVQGRAVSFREGKSIPKLLGEKSYLENSRCCSYFPINLKPRKRRHFQLPTKMVLSVPSYVFQIKRRYKKTHFDQPLGFFNTRFQLTKGVTSQKTGDPNASQTPFGWKIGIRKKKDELKVHRFRFLE